MSALNTSQYSLTYHENVVCVWNLAPSSEELTEIVKLGRNIKELFSRIVNAYAD